MDIDIGPAQQRARRLELTIVLSIIGLLIILFIEPIIKIYTNVHEHVVHSNLGTLRSSIGVYFGENQRYPTDDLTCLTGNGSHYLPAIPWLKTASAHAGSRQVITGGLMRDSGSWYYDNDPTSPRWGTVSIDCFHPDSKGQVWSTY